MWDSLVERLNLIKVTQSRPKYPSKHGYQPIYYRGNQNRHRTAGHQAWRCATSWVDF